MRPDAANSTGRPSFVVAPSRTDTDSPRASVICEAIVRCQISSYSRNSCVFSWLRTSSGVRKVSPAGRIASCASCAFLTFFVYWRGASGR